ncbi:uncharacterized protein LOC143184428 [Calliopsis andreniformis]|uniref:uncharacterized protein LOC143184428 n=1 Tax=Calliopsis andreniformis TaxID=337506 RepID=UPI003FCCC7E2
MNGRGTYTFPDGSSIEAIWLDNKPLTDIIFREPLGFTWIVENMTENGILFSRGNHFWNELSDQSHAHSTESLGQNESIIDESNETKNDI